MEYFDKFYLWDSEKEFPERPIGGNPEVTPNKILSKLLRKFLEKFSDELLLDVLEFLKLFRKDILEFSRKKSRKKLLEETQKQQLEESWKLSQKETLEESQK